jgi:hypothetical protein
MAVMRRGLGLRHPSDGRLRAWLDTGEPAGVGEHVEQCERCADRLEAIDLENAPLRLDGSASLREALGELVAPPTDLGDRVRHGIERRGNVERELMLLTGLLSIGVETAQLMFDAGASDEPNTTPPGDTERNEKGHIT